jgi:RNA polymerase sigma-70 factor, ECF subfamily
MMTLAPEPRSAEARPVESASPDPAAPSAEEAALIRQAAAGDTRAFGELVHVHHRRVFNFLAQMTRHQQDAEDLTQQTFIKALRHLARFDQRRPIINWLLTIARHNAINHFRDGNKWEQLTHEPAGAEPSPARRAEQRELADNLWARARELLSAREFEVLWLRFGEEMTTRETAEVVDLTETHVKVILFRARQALLKGVKPT